MSTNHIESIVNEMPISEQVDVYNKLNNWEGFEELPQDEPNYYVPNSVRGDFLYFLERALGRYFNDRRKPNSHLPFLWSDIVEEKTGDYRDRHSRYNAFMKNYINKNVEDLTQEDLMCMLNKLDELNGEIK